MIDDIAGHDCVVSIEDGLRMGGAGAEVRDALGERAPRAEFECSACPPNTSRTTIPTPFTPGSGSTAKGIAASVRARSDRSRPAGGRTQV